MRTFSLIWSGIGCFATVAITVFGGVILAKKNTNAEFGGLYALDICVCNFIEGAAFGGNYPSVDLRYMTSVPSPSHWGDDGIIRYNVIFKVGDQIVLGGLNFSKRMYYGRFGTLDVSFSENDTKATITLASTAADASILQYCPDLADDPSSNPYAWSADRGGCFVLFIVSLGSVRSYTSSSITAHISMDE
jgi:hypothetical protein